jgi:hypothetical protein
MGRKEGTEEYNTLEQSCDCKQEHDDEKTEKTTRPPSSRPAALPSTHHTLEHILLVERSVRGK